MCYEGATALTEGDRNYKLSKMTSTADFETSIHNIYLLFTARGVENDEWTIRRDQKKKIVLRRWSGLTGGIKAG